jgi:hypothetical protein
MNFPSLILLYFRIKFYDYFHVPLLITHHAETVGAGVKM